MINMKKLIILISSLLLMFTTGCMSNTTTIKTTKNTKTTTTQDDDYTGYYMKEYDNPLKDLDMGGSDTLTLDIAENTITIENEKARIILNKQNGGIKELANKESHLYLTKNSNSKPFTYAYIGSEIEHTSFKNFAYEVIDDTDAVKRIKLIWTLENNEVLEGFVMLGKDDNEFTFNINVSSTSISNPIYYIEYPIVEGIGSLYNQNTDYLAHPFATGYLFKNPLSNFNSLYRGIDREMGLYPSGWETPMQFYAYYSECIGGFMFMTKDGKDTIKSFSFTGGNNKLRASIYHYADEYSTGKIDFNYDIAIGNLIEGRWEEAAEKYKDWATCQEWCINGKRIDRTDLDKTFYEEVVLCNFCYPYGFSYGDTNQAELYRKMKNNINGKFFNIFFVADSIVSLSHKYDDYIAKFEFPDFINMKDKNGSEVLDMHRNPVPFNLNGVQQAYECPTDNNYMERFTKIENDLRTNYKVNGYYHDVGVAAVHPKQCFNTTHSHGTRINMISEYLNQMAYVKELSAKNGATIYGQELIFEQMIPYIDFYQARANSRNLGFMEGDRFNELIKKGDCYPINMFDYIYMEYTGIRLDGFLTPDDNIKEPYYYIAQYTVIHGGIPEYNYEFIEFANYLSPDEQSGELMSYIDYLGIVRQTFGQNYLVYGSPTRAPKFETGTIKYNFCQTKDAQNNVGNGSMIVDKIISSAYEYNDKIGIFFANNTTEEQETYFVLDAYKYYGIKNGKVTYVDEDGDYQLADVKNGLARISLNIKPRKIVLLEVEGK